MKRPSFQNEIPQTIRRLCELPHLHPLEVAKILNRRPRLMHEDEYAIDYDLVGGTEFPWGRVGLRWLKNIPGGILGLIPSEGIRLCVTDLEGEFGEWASEGSEEIVYLSGNPREANPLDSLIYRVSVGELRVIFYPPLREDIPVEKIGVTEVPAVAWKGARV